MKTNFPSATTRDSIWSFFDNYWLLLITIINWTITLSFPILGYIFIHKVGGIILGLIFSAGWFWLVGLEIKNAFKNKKLKALLWLILNNISMANFAVMFVVFMDLFVCWISGAFHYFEIPSQTFISFIFYYYCIIIPVSILFGLVLTFGEDKLKEALEKEGEDKNKRLAKYFNPLFLPFSVVAAPFIFVFLIYKTCREVRTSFKSVWN
ncbi:MAG: hypothetical protein WAV10_02890 [Minisyncoccia bacterium]